MIPDYFRPLSLPLPLELLTRAFWKIRLPIAPARPCAGRSVQCLALAASID
jgi:hypothetical protein